MRIAVVALLVLLLTAPASAKTTATWTVRDFGDRAAGAQSSDPGPEGSLRFLIMKRAKPGDTIAFERPGEVALTGPIEIRSELKGLRIVGTVGEARAGLRDRSAVPGWRTQTGAGFGLIVKADGVTVHGLTFTDTPLVLTSPTTFSTLRGGTVTGNLFNGRHGYLVLSEADDVLVQHNDFAGSQDSAIETVDTADLRVVDNHVHTTRRAIVDLTLGVRTTLRDNQFENAGTSLEQVSGTVTRNRFEGGSVALRDRSAGGGLDVTNNRFAGTAVEVVMSRDLTFAGNPLVDGPFLVGCSTRGNLKGARRVLVRANTVKRGLLVRCEEPDAVRVRQNTVSGSEGDGIRVAIGDGVLLDGNRVSGNRGGGITFGGGTSGVVDGGFARQNRLYGVGVSPDAQVEVRGVATGGNGGPAIDVAPPGPSANAVRKLGNGDQDWPAKLEFDKQKPKLRGVTCKGCRVDVYEAEDGDEHGEGIRHLGSVVAGSSGAFQYPAKGDLDCPDSGRVTVTATKRGPHGVTSELSEDVECSCVVSREFVVDRAKVPKNGFANFGLTVEFPNGTTVEPGVLDDPATEKRPAELGLGPLLVWEEFNRKPLPALAAGYFGLDFFVSVHYADSQAAASATGRVRWRYRVAYDPPRGAKRCGAIVRAAS